MIRKVAKFARLAGLATGLALGLAGCFQPVHGPGLSAVTTALPQITVDPIGGHIGHHLKSELDFLLNNGTPPAQPLYRLKVLPSGAGSPIVADSATGRPQIMAYHMAASYVLTSIKDGRVVSSGSAQVQASYDRNSQRFAAVRSVRDVEIRAATQMAEQIKIRIIPGLAGLKD